ncbi:MAG: hypothetical protein R3211_03835 [Balneolaceae bacterium]|nr:hypothetical protein [Balneolaceae bacterium]
MRIPQKYFIAFLVIMALVAALIIVYGTFHYQKGVKREFREELAKSDSLIFEPLPLVLENDTIAIADFRDRFVILDFWSVRIDFSTVSHPVLARMKNQFEDTLRVLSAVVKDRREEIQQYQRKHRYPFTYVDGTALFNKLKMPGLPTQILFSPEGDIVDIFTGYTDSTQYDSLRSLMRHE